MIEEPRCLRVVRWVALTVLGEAHSLGMTLTRRLMPDARCNTAMLRKLVISLAHRSPVVEPVLSVSPSYWASLKPTSTSCPSQREQ